MAQHPFTLHMHSLLGEVAGPARRRRTRPNKPPHSVRHEGRLTTPTDLAQPASGPSVPPLPLGTDNTPANHARVKSSKWKPGLTTQLTRTSCVPTGRADRQNPPGTCTCGSCAARAFMPRPGTSKTNSPRHVRLYQPPSGVGSTQALARYRESVCVPRRSPLKANSNGTNLRDVVDQHAL